MRPVCGGISLSHSFVAAFGKESVHSDDLVLDSFVDSGIVAPEIVVECMFDVLFHRCLLGRSV